MKQKKTDFISIKAKELGNVKKFIENEIFV